jgi:hypothetical protein
VKAEWIGLQSHQGKSGRLIALEAPEEIPFPVARVYFVLAGDPTVALGRHAHRRGEQLLVCVRGSCTLTLDDGSTTQDFVIDRPDRGLLFGPLLWEEFTLSAEAVLLVLCEAPYDPADQIENREEFLALVERDD